MALLDEVCHCGGGFEVSNAHTRPCHASAGLQIQF